MKKTLLNSLKSMILAMSIVALPFAAAPAFATGVDVFSAGCSAASGSGGSGGSICGAGTSSGNNDFATLTHNIVTAMLTVLGIIAVIMIVIGGIRYTTSNGDAAQVKSAKDTILYSVVGLIVAIMAYAIVNFVLSSFKK